MRCCDCGRFGDGHCGPRPHWRRTVAAHQALPPDHAARLFDAQAAGASEQQLRDITTEGLGEMYLRGCGRRAHGLGWSSPTSRSWTSRSERPGFAVAGARLWPVSVVLGQLNANELIQSGRAEPMPSREVPAVVQVSLTVLPEGFPPRDRADTLELARSRDGGRFYERECPDTYLSVTSVGVAGDRARSFATGADSSAAPERASWASG